MHLVGAHHCCRCQRCVLSLGFVVDGRWVSSIVRHFSRAVHCLRNKVSNLFFKKNAPPMIARVSTKQKQKQPKATREDGNLAARDRESARA